MRIRFLRWFTHGLRKQPSQWWWQRKALGLISITWLVRLQERKTSTPAEVNHHLTASPSTVSNKKYSIIYHIVDNQLHLGYSLWGLIPLLSYMLTCSHVVASGTSGDDKPTALTLLFSSVLLHGMCHPEMLWEYCFLQIKLDRDNEWIARIWECLPHIASCLWGSLEEKERGGIKITYPWSEPLGL